MITYNLQPQIHSNLLNSKRVNIINELASPIDFYWIKKKGKYLPCYMVATIYRAFSTNKVETKKNISYKKLSRLTEEKNLSNLQFSELVFTGIINILKNNPINQNTQIKIERFVRNQFSDFFENKNKDITLGLGIDKNKVNKEFIDFMFNINNELSNLFKKRKKNITRYAIF